MINNKRSLQMSDFIPVANPQFSEDDARAVSDVVNSGWVSMGKKVQEFEQLVCDYN
jgi:Predicted pyridoxal phosphate-dependent enzyme apparently involved in regulation of cell wall biogenesis